MPSLYRLILSFLLCLPIFLASPAFGALPSRCAVIFGAHPELAPENASFLSDRQLRKINHDLLKLYRENEVSREQMQKLVHLYSRFSVSRALRLGHMLRGNFAEAKRNLAKIELEMRTFTNELAELIPEVKAEELRSVSRTNNFRMKVFGAFHLLIAGSSYSFLGTNVVTQPIYVPNLKFRQAPELVDELATLESKVGFDRAYSQLESRLNSRANGTIQYRIWRIAINLASLVMVGTHLYSVPTSMQRVETTAVVEQSTQGADSLEAIAFQSYDAKISRLNIQIRNESNVQVRANLTGELAATRAQRAQYQRELEELAREEAVVSN